MRTISLAIISALSLAAVASTGKSLKVENLSLMPRDGYLNVNADLVLDSLKLDGNRQLFVTPIVKGASGQEVVLPSVLVNGKKMHYAYQRGSLKGFEEIKNHDILTEICRRNGTPQTVEYTQRVPLEKWMRLEGTSVAFVYDSCGCGARYGRQIYEQEILYLNPAKEMRTAMMTPAVTELPVQIHEGRARVQFEVDRTELHPDVYKCRNGQKIDNRAQLKMIDDSVHYALTDPNVEISEIAICGYASPESPYRHNDELATGRSRALAEYLGQRYNLPPGRTSYKAVPENWGEFREMVVNSDELTETQRKDLLELIDRPPFTPDEYDNKEQELKTSPKFEKLYKTKLLPEWFPKLRATTFAISTRLKPMSDEQLAKIIDTTPEKMSLNQMFRVARLYPEGSDEFNRVIKIALEHYPDDPTANLNAAAACVAREEYDEAKRLLEKAGDTPEVWNLKGIIATREGEFEQAEEYFRKAGALPEAAKNLNLL